MTFGQLYESAEFVGRHLAQRPQTGMILGSGLGMLAEKIQNPVVIPYEEIPHFLRSTAPSHAGKLICGQMGGRYVVCMSGRFHYYEGYEFEQLTMPIRLFKLLGVEESVLTNAAGSVNPTYRPGDVMLLRDHIKLMGASPLRGRNMEEFGPRFFDMSTVYDRSLRKLALQCAEKSGLTVHEGVYFFSGGPQFETPAEIRAMGLLGADAVGMSTVTEVLTAAHCKMPVLAMSLITNYGAGLQSNPLTTEEVDEATRLVRVRLEDYMLSILEALTERSKRYGESG